MKKLVLISFGIVINFICFSQTTTNSVSLVDDQNPNFERSRSFYMKSAANLTEHEGQTIQETYKAIDDMELKKERKELKLQRRHEIRLARINNRRHINRYYWNRYNGYNNYGYNGYSNYYGNNNYGYNNYGYNNYGYNNYNQPYQPLGNYSPQSNILGGVNAVLGTALLGLTIYSLFH